MRWLKLVGGGVLGLIGLAAVGLFVCKQVSDGKFARQQEVPAHDFPIPFPLTDVELATLREERAATLAAAAPPPAEGAPAEVVAAADPLEGVDLGAIALERAIARGKHLVESRYVCVECHGQDFGGGRMVEDPLIGQLLGPNLTTGAGSRTLEYKATDWSRAVRHGVAPAGTLLVMPADDFFEMADRELSDIVSYIRSMPPVDKEVPPRALGPLAWFLHANGTIVLAADKRTDHTWEHKAEPPPTEDTVEFGRHMSQICTGCHLPDFTGGPIAGGDPSWAPAMNLTPDASGLQGWTFEQFERTLRSGVRPDGTPLKLPMTLLLPYMQNVTDTEMRALWRYISQVPPKPSAY